MGSGRILLVDDEPQLVELMRRYLDRLGYQTAAACTTEEAWGIVEQGPAFAAAIIDRSMSGPCGEEFIRRVLAAHPETKAILTSGYASDMRELETAFPGRVRFLQKPFSGEMLAEAVRRLAG